MGRIVDHDDRRRAIVEAAKRLILAGGFSAATMRTIAAEAGYANGALKYYFPAGKADIVQAAFLSVLDEIEAQAATSAGGDPLPELRRYLRSWFPADTSQIANGKILVELWEHAMADDAIARLYAQHLTRWQTQIAGRLTRACDAGAIAKRPSFEPVAGEYLAFLMGTVVLNLMFPAGERLPAVELYLDELLERLSCS